MCNCEEIAHLHCTKRTKSRERSEVRVRCKCREGVALKADVAAECFASFTV